MNKYFVKIVAILLFVAILPVTSGFCFDDILSSSLAPHAMATTYDSMPMNQTACGVQSGQEPVRHVMPQNKHAKSVLPCCVDGDHSEIVASLQVVERAEALPIFFSNVNIQASPIIKKIAYYTSIVSPPKLFSVRTVIMRI